MSKSNTKFQLGDRIILQETKEVGVITKLTPEGEPELVLSGNKIINVIDKIISHASNLIAIWRFIKSIFKF
jgi:hypothetical protein